MYPYVTGIMPIQNEAEFIRCRLGVVLAQDYSADRMDVLVVDGMSTDATRKIVNDLAARHAYLYIFVLDNPGQIVQVGIKIALYLG